MTALDLLKQESEAFWADLRQKARTLQADIAQAEEDADNLLLDLTRAQMGIAR